MAAKRGASEAPVCPAELPARAEGSRFMGALAAAFASSESVGMHAYGVDGSYVALDAELASLAMTAHGDDGHGDDRHGHERYSGCYECGDHRATPTVLRESRPRAPSGPPAAAS